MGTEHFHKKSKKTAIRIDVWQFSLQQFHEKHRKDACAMN